MTADRKIPGILKLTASEHLKMDGWNTIVSFWYGLSSGSMLVLGTVFLKPIVNGVYDSKDS